MKKKIICAFLPLVILNSIVGEEANIITNIRQLTFEGKRSGEGYFGPNGNLMVFQSERDPKNPFYQIYLMNLLNGDIERISPGFGKTTCGWIHPDKEHVLFASTHKDPQSKDKQIEELKIRESGKERRYAWDYDENFELYIFNRKTKNITQVTNTIGYDAEGAISPDGNWIVFSSNRLAYNSAMSKKDKKLFQVDKSFMIDIYKMKIDGTEIQRLTKSKGYDGGPFFSSDGKKICWRRFSEDGVLAEIYTMDSDGRNKKQLTNMQAMSWAPFFHPSGKYLIYSTNKHGFSNFELYIVSLQGGEPIRVTYSDRFDGLPTFSPDGKTLSWTSQRSNDNKSHIFFADWNHELSLDLLNDTQKDFKPQRKLKNTKRVVSKDPSITVAELKNHVEILASEDYAGRKTGTEGELKATEYVAEEFEKIGLDPGGSSNSYFQEFEFTSGIEIKKTSSLIIQSPKKSKQQFQLNKDWRPVNWSATGSLINKEVVWAGYGIHAPEEKQFKEYSSFVHLDVKDKLVMILRYMPENISSEHRQHLSRYSSLRYKAMTLRDKGAAGMIIVSGPASAVKKELISKDSGVTSSPTSIPVISITDNTAKTLLCIDEENNCQSLKALQQDLDNGDIKMGFLTDAKLSINIDLVKKKTLGRNVIGVLFSELPGKEPPLIIGGHVDNLGVGGDPSSLANENEKQKIHFGADDNASGIASIIEMAEWFAHEKASKKLTMKRDIVFAAWSGEEQGLLGSTYFVNNLAKINNTNDLSNIVAAYLNLDMVGRYRESLVVNGVGSSLIWKREIERRNAPIGLNIELKEDSYLPTDAPSFFLKKIPILSLFTGSHPQYHTPHDTPDLINYKGIEQITKFLVLIGRSLVTTEDEPNYQEPKNPQTEIVRAGLRAYLGTIPDYGDSEVPGLKLSGVTKEAPADKAGMKAGDIIIELAGRKIENIYDYTYAIDAVKIGQKARIVVIRKNKKIELEIIPGSRE